MSKKHVFQKKVSFLVSGNFRRKHHFYSVFWFRLFWSQKSKCLAKTDSVHENARFSSLPDTNSVRQFLLKCHFFDFSHFWMTTLKKYYFHSLFLPFPFILFFFSLFLFLLHKKDKNKKLQFLFESLIFDIQPILQKHYVDTLLHYLCHTVKIEKNSEKKNLDQFLTYSLDQFLTFKRPHLGQVCNSAAQMYIGDRQNTVSESTVSNTERFCKFHHRPLMGLFRGPFSTVQGVPEKRPLALIGCFPPLIMSRLFPLMGRFRVCLSGPFSLLRSETGRIRFRRAWFQTLSSVSLFGLTKFRERTQ